MFALESVIADRLAAEPELRDWRVVAASGDGKRGVFPEIVVQCEGAQAADSKTSAVSVVVAWGVHLIARRCDETAEKMDAAFAGVIRSLLNFNPGAVAGRGWSALRVLRVDAPEPIDQGLVEYVVIFQSQAAYMGQP